MADNVHRKSHKLLDNKKLSVIPIHRTTTETIRLGELEKFQQTASISSLNNVANNNQCRKKTSSFQITSVTVGCRMSNDAGEDSNDDLDESHTEDNSVEHSRVTDIDIETPSYSEDTFSKEDVFFNTSNAALSTAPVIPTSSQYGLAIVPSEGNSVNHSVNDNNINTLNISSVTDNNIINLLSSNTKQDSDIREVHSPGRNERFKVVKIESTEPFKRGRWTCMDYLDHTSVNQSAAITTLKVSTDPHEVCISYGITDTGAVIPDTLKQTAASMDDKGADACHIQPQHQDVHSSVSMSSNSTISNASYTVNRSIGQNVQHNPATQVQNQTQVPPHQMSQYFQPSPQQLQQQQGGQGATLQPNHPNNLGLSQSMSQGSISVATQPNNKSVTPQPNINHPKEDPYATVTPPSQPLASQNVCPPTAQSSVPRPTVSPPANAPANILVSNVPQHQPQPPHSQQQSQHHHSQTQTQLPQQQSQSQVAETITGITGIQSISNIHKVPQSTSQQPPPNMHSSVSPMTQSQMQAQASNSNSQVQMTSASCQSIISAIQSGNVTFHHAEQEDSNSTLVVSSASQSADATLIESLAEVTQSNDDHHILEDNESMSGTSAVAIDNKIEQAMDLVKSHLMFAVREEVEVLKEKIAELMDRINQLEAENSILKSHATPDILAQLSSLQSTTKMPQSNNSGNGQ